MMHADNLASELDQMAASLGGVSQTADSRLVAIGERLGGAIESLAELTRLFEELPQELENHRLRAAADSLEKISRQTAGMTAALADERAALSRLAALNFRTGGCIEQLAKTVRAISILAVNAQIEAAHIDTMGEDLSVFAREIIRLARAAAATIEGYAQDHKKLEGLLRSACETQADFLSRHEKTLGAVAQQLLESIRLVDGRRSRAAGSASEIGRRAQRISAEIGVAVMALQIGDSTRQRLEHVAEALNQVSAGLVSHRRGPSDGMSWSANLTDGQKASVAASVCRMQAAQMTQAGADFEREISRVITSLRSLADEASAIVDFGADVYGTAGPHGQSFLDDIEESLDRTGALLKECEAGRETVDSVVASVTDSLCELLKRLGSVRRVEADMRLVGLNTVLKCGRLGNKGRTIRVIAQELRGYANQTLEHADALMSALQDIAEAAREFERYRQDRGARRIADVEQDMATSLSAFQECGARLNRALEVLVQEGGEVRRTLRETAEGITEHDNLGRILKAACDRLDRIVGAGVIESEDADLVAERVRLVAKDRYTMASERAIHQQFATGGSDLDASGAVALSSSEASLDDILF